MSRPMPPPPRAGPGGGSRCPRPSQRRCSSRSWWPGISRFVRLAGRPTRRPSSAAIPCSRPRSRVGPEPEQSPEPSRLLINEWAERKDPRPDQGSRAREGGDTLTRLVLLNAIYFKADWAVPLEATQTKEEDVHAAGAAKVRAPIPHNPIIRGGKYAAFNARGRPFQTPSYRAKRAVSIPLGVPRTFRLPRPTDRSFSPMVSRARAAACMQR